MRVTKRNPTGSAVGAVPAGSAVGAVLVGSAAGLALGLLTALVNDVPGMLGEVGQAHSQDSAATWAAIYLSQLLDSGWAWAVTGFGIGWLVAGPASPLRRVPAAAGAAVLGLVLATLAFYVVKLPIGDAMTGPSTVYWLVRAVVFGLPLGAAGAWARRPGVVGLLAALTAPACAVANMLLFPIWPTLPGESPARAWAAVTVWVLAAAGVALLTARFLAGRRPSATPTPATPTPAAPTPATPIPAGASGAGASGAGAGLSGAGAGSADVTAGPGTGRRSDSPSGRSPE
ncbi:hypothetical protein [Mangrovihabitans endophyticus]|uniref:Uncharacterized protein n=1 Tax=Mangrovihabitans endophyticus TaxID=1751298 RepID=A0A8J3C016_9ACTN|nr:hypothetical protein [Mangrovihabitans endophyticus]GGK91374.1 hypothetical protein GCM10012284_26530 [Mangrovihabitans endophyticus]